METTPKEQLKTLPELITEPDLNELKNKYSEIQLSNNEITKALNHTRSEIAAEKRINPSSVVLSEYDREYALMTVRSRKHGETKTKEYWRDLNKPKIGKPKRTAENYLNTYLSTINQNTEKPFELFDFNKEIVINICKYFAEDESGPYKLKKGLLIIGPVGGGKTALMKTFLNNDKMPFNIKDCREIGDNFLRIGISALDEYLNIHNRLSGYCFDDFGWDTGKKIYGNEINPMERILDTIYKSGQFTKCHLTTNLNMEMIEQQYGTRIRDRIREMFNCIVLNNKFSLRTL